MIGPLDRSRTVSLACLFLGAVLLVDLSCSSHDGTPGRGPGADSGVGGASPSAGGSSTVGTSGSGGVVGTGAAGAGPGAGGAGTGGGAVDHDAATGGAADSGPSADPCKTARYCEGFESYATGMPPGGDWKAQTNHGAVSIVDGPKYSGQKAAKFTTEENTDGKTAFLELGLASVFPVPGNVYYGRMMFWLEAAPEASVHWTFIQSGGLVPGQTYHALYRYGGQQPVTAGGKFVGSQLMANYETPDSYSGNGPSSDCWHPAKGTVAPVAKWACVEWQFDGAHDTMNMWLNDLPLPDMTVKGTGQGCVHQPASFEWAAPNFENLEIGWESYQTDSARTLYIDDVVVSMDRVHCPKSP